MPGKRKLTAVKITNIQNYYGRAIKDHYNDIELVKERIYAILFHMSSTNVFPKHRHCHPSEKSCYFCLRAIVKDSTPGSIQNIKLVPIFKRPAEKNLCDIFGFSK